MNSDPRSCSLDVDLGRIKVTSPERRQRIGNVFDRIAARYDLMRFRIHGRREFVLKTDSFSLPRLAAAALLAVVAISTARAQEVWREPVTGMDFVRVPGGCFEMGDTFGDGETNELPVHKVCMKPYWIGRHEVTQAQWTRLMDYNMSIFNASPAHPVDSVNQADIAAFVGKLGGHHPDKVFRVPTEAEWEYAARAGSRTRFPAGDDPSVLLTTANTFDSETALRWPRWREQAGAGSDGFAFTAPVGSFKPNAFGLYDMIGNAWEWCSDWYDENYYAQSPAEDPKGPAEGTVRVRRGGSWHSWPLYARSAFRNWNTPSTRYVLVGFRLVREAAVAPQR